MVFRFYPNLLRCYGKKQASKEGVSSEKLTPEEIKKKIEVLTERIKVAKIAENKRNARQLGVTLENLQERTVKLKAIKAIYEHLLTALKKGIAHEKEEAILRKKVGTKDQVGIVQKPPYNLSFYDNLTKQMKLAELSEELYRKQVSWVRSHLHFDESDLQKQLGIIEVRRKELKKRLRKLVPEQRRIEEAWRKTYQAVLEQTEVMRGLLGNQEKIWRNRYSIVRD